MYYITHYSYDALINYFLKFISMLKSSQSAMNLSRIKTEVIGEKPENGHEHKETNGKDHDHKVNIDVLKYNKIPDISKLIPASHIY